jgi:ABC-type polysaccharide/polyol phosphate transport system ATPase subunit
LPDLSLEAAEVWKRFRSDQRKPRLRDEIERMADRARGNSERGFRWALRDIGFAIEPGGSIGLIGANGSGKSTLLKILTRVMYPTAGSVRTTGRVGALIEVRSGIHPDLTGRENIYLMGSLMGLPRKRIAQRFDEIVAFSELEQAIDRQVKFYSTGMQMRLGFGVAAFLEPDVLLVDEVLAVGDAAFQQRCLDRMRHVLQQGTTLVFVSHDLAAVEATCRRGIWLHNGEMQADGPVRETLAAYRASVDKGAGEAKRIQGRISLTHAEIVVPGGDIMPRTKGPLEVRLTLESDMEYPGAWIYVGVSEGTAAPIFVICKKLYVAAGRNEVRCLIADLPLPGGRYYVWTMAHEQGVRTYDGAELFGWQPVASFEAYGPSLDPAPTAIVRLAPLYVEASWEHERG